jgi:transposase
LQQGTGEQVSEPDWAAFIAIDWADQKHDWAMQVAGKNKREHGQVAHTPEAIQTWVAELGKRFGDRPIAVALEQSRGALLFALSKYANLVLYPLHPATASCFRQAMYPSGSKDDPRDADVQLELLLKHRERLQVWKPDTEPTRELQFLVEDRRRLVGHKTALLNQLTGRLKLYFPQTLSWFASADSVLLWRLLEQWPELKALQKVPRQKLKAFLQQDARSAPADVDAFLEQVRAAVPATQDAAVVSSGVRFVQGLVRQLQLLKTEIQGYEKHIQAIVEQHPDFPMVDSFPGVGKALAPRLIAALGTQRARFPDAASIQSYSGIAPVREASGKREWVHARWACPKFVKQTFQEWAQHSLADCTWARAHYQAQRARGKGHQAAVRSVAFKWIRILFRCWKDRTMYDENRYTEDLARHSATTETTVQIVWKKDAGFFRPALLQT